MRKYKNVPKIRFEEFNEEWSKEQLRKLVDIFDGTHQTPKYTKNGVKFVSVENIKSLETDKYISIDDFIKEYSSKIPQKGDVLMTRIGDIGTTNIVKSDEALGYYVTLALLKPKNIDGIYLSYSINSKSVQKDLWRRTLHIAFPKKINLGEIEKIEIKFPKLEEQIMIGNYFENLDNLISLQKQKYEKLLNLKKAMLNKLFPKEGETTPEIRFDGFSDEWEKKKLLELGESTSGVSMESEFNKNGQLKVISIGSYSENSKYIDQGIRSSINNKTSNRILSKDDLTMILNDKTASGNIIGRVLLIEENNKYIYNQRTERIEIYKEKFNPNFLYHMLNSNYIRSKIIKLAQGNTQIYVNWSTIKEIEYLIPRQYNEQKVIGEYFSKLDKLIELNKAKLEKLKNIKSSLLDNMFV